MHEKGETLEYRARLLDGRPIAAERRAALAQEAKAFAQQFGRPPSLAVVLATPDPASRLYSARLVKAGRDLGFCSEVVAVEEPTPRDIGATLERLNRDVAVDGILVQMPLPAPLTVSDVSAVIDPEKDVDGVSIVNVGRIAMGFPGFAPTTPLGGIELLRSYDVPIAGRSAVVVGRSNVVGRPFASLLVAADATVTICHSKTPDVARFTRQADIVAVAVGKPGLLTGEAIRPGATVIDFGTTPTPAGLRGDADFESVAQVADWITPVPGGTGPMTVVLVLRQTLEAAWARARRAPGAPRHAPGAPRHAPGAPRHAPGAPRHEGYTGNPPLPSE